MNTKKAVKTAPSAFESRPEFLKRLQRTVAWLNERQRREGRRFCAAEAASLSCAAPSQGEEQALRSLEFSFVMLHLAKLDLPSG